ncbi:Stp1/IreP family PP2C-type Ser/Thr phosphatase [Candidatus Nitronereus thalassa]|uniref:Stp1/IreP family PP2C-type Ser/Thr phosphatase n=1 Tax=Candidatus Nitronereus thalassa TaxID=3020898 RepID=A0ABU3K4U5_9BACT|nr:Stp1/IreP family PP2C-type Ser/Thr phosphatase [Candidatus Nitronereus thalassa]MDT7041378.1 Stp1/IreP family PP2C-type Ser/Thr phosphatase [Candidatus Nitronereus thalassa]
MPMKPEWTGFGLTDVGRTRTANQDTLLLDDDLGLWIVADGMGGHAGGDVASQLAVETIRKFLLHQPPTTVEKWAPVLETSIAQANMEIRKQAKAQPELQGMGTTIVLAFMPNPQWKKTFILHAGDSRAYLIRAQFITALTRDHTLLEERIQVGLLPRSTSSSHPLGHVLTRAVGVESTVEPEIFLQELEEKDAILLCSDGLVKMMSDNNILEVLQENSTKTAQEQCQALVDRANQLGGKDNITVVLIRED